MEILVITGSPHKQGTSSYLAEQFIKGAQENGHEIFRFDAAFSGVKGCLGCNYCRNHEEVCVQKDGMEKILEILLKVDMVVFVTPLYFSGMSAQLKTIIDRFYPINERLQTQEKQTMLFATCNDQGESVKEGLITHYKEILNNFGWEEKAILFAQGFNTRKEIEASKYGNEAYELGKKC